MSLVKNSLNPNSYSEQLCKYYNELQIVHLKDNQYAIPIKFLAGCIFRVTVLALSLIEMGVILLVRSISSLYSYSLGNGKLHIINNQFLSAQAVFQVYSRMNNYNGLISIIYYPGQRDLPLGHAELEFGGNCYAILYNAEIQGSLKERSSHAQQGGLVFFQTRMRVTPQEFLAIQDSLSAGKKSFSTCMGGISKVLRNSTGIKLPRIIELSPLLSFAFLNFAKYFGNKRIHDIKQHGTFTGNIRNLLFCCAGISYEAIVISVLCSVIGFFQASLIASILYQMKTVRPNLSQHITSSFITSCNFG